MSRWFEFFVLRACHRSRSSSHLHALYQKDDLFVSANTKLCGPGLMAHIRSKELATEFRSAIIDRLQKRHGTDFDLEIETFQITEQKRLMKRIERDSQIVELRLASGNFAPNVRPLAGDTASKS